MNTSHTLRCLLNAAEGQLDIILYESSQLATSRPSMLCPQNPRILCAQSWLAPTKGAELLTPALQSLCTLQKIPLKDITHFACVHGPGSFTGIRLTMSTVAAIRRITGASNASIDYMQALALTAALNLAPVFAKKELYFCVLTHAKRHVVHCQYFSLSAQQEAHEYCENVMHDAHTGMPNPFGTPPYLPQSQGPAFLCAPENILAHKPQTLHTHKAPLFILGSGLMRHYEVISPLLQAQDFALPLEQPSPKALCLLAENVSYHEHDLEPLYVRPCDAVENLNAIAQKQGMDATQAHARLQILLNARPEENI